MEKYLSLVEKLRR